MTEYHLLFKGSVQGVGFRATALKFANQLNLKGTAKNLPDHSVEIYIQGNIQEINQFIEKVKTHFDKNILEFVCTEKSSPFEAYNSFTIIR